MDNLQENIAKWDNRATNYDKNVRTKFFTSILSMVIDTIALNPGMTFLDIGCGTGWGVKYAYDKVKGEGKFYGVDVSGKMIAIAKEKYRDIPSIKFILSSAENINLEKESIDRIICTNSFHHYPNPGAVLANAYKILKKEGIFAIADVTTDSVFPRLLNRLLKWWEKGHVTFYNSVQYEQMFKEAGLKYSSKAINSMIKIHIGTKL